jgi:hypothetical protein
VYRYWIRGKYWKRGKPNTRSDNFSPRMPCQNVIEMVCEIASKDSNWSVLLPLPNWNGIRTTKVVTSVIFPFLNGRLHMKASGYWLRGSKGVDPP